MFIKDTSMSTKLISYEILSGTFDKTPVRYLFHRNTRNMSSVTPILNKPTQYQTMDNITITTEQTLETINKVMMKPDRQAQTNTQKINETKTNN